MREQAPSGGNRILFPLDGAGGSYIALLLSPNLPIQASELRVGQIGASLDIAMEGDFLIG